MARKGYFGRQPRSAPSLSNTLVAIAREYQQQRAENIMSAWQKGGMFEGRKATDEVVLAFWRKRVDGVSKDDPLHDTYKNAVTQLDYNINESKMTADYAQGKKTDQQMVAFFMNWSKKVPKNSEFYRVLMRDAGQYMRNAKAKSEAEAKRLAEERYQRQQDSTRKNMESAGEYAIDLIRRLAQSGNATRAIGPAIAAPGSGSDLTDFDPRDPNVMMRLMDLVTMPSKTDVTVNGFAVVREEAGTSEVLFHDDNGKAITGADIIKTFQQLDPNFKAGTPFNVGYVTDLLDRQQRGLDERIERATKTGHMQDVSNLTKSKEYVSLLKRQVKSYPVQKLYQEARAEYDAVTNDPTASPQAVYNAWQKYSGTLTSLSKDPRIEANDSMRAQLAAEAAAEPGTPTLNETFTGLAGGDFNGEARDIAINNANIYRIYTQVEQVKATAALPDDDPNKVVYTYGKLDDNGNFVPQAGGAVVGAATVDKVNGAGAMAKTVTVDDPRGGQPMKMMVGATPVFAVARDPRTGDALPSTGDTPIAYAYNIPKGGQSVVTYGFQTKDGFRFSENPPWQDGLKAKGVTKDGSARFEVDFTPVIESALGGKDPLTGEWKNPTALDKPVKDFAPGITIQPGTKKGDLTRIGIDPAMLAHASDERDWTGAPDPATDFTSLTLANLMRDSEGHRILQSLDKHALFKDQMTDDNFFYSGAQRDPKTGAWLAETADQTRLNQAAGQMNRASAAKDLMEWAVGSIGQWSRAATGSAYVDTKKSIFGAITGDIDLGKLATDVVKNTPFAALGNAFAAGTNNINRGENGVTPNGFVIKPVGAIKAPVVKAESHTVVTKPNTPGVSTGAAPAAQTGSNAPTQSGATMPKPNKDGVVFANGTKYYV